MRKPLRSINTLQVGIIAYCLLLFGYVLFRALNLSFTFDEVTTSQIVNGDDWANFGASANNHFLNVVLIKASLKVFEPSELVYRLPNVLGFILYLVYAVKIGKFLKPNAPHIPVILLTAMPFILDFFGLARGYGLALSFILPSIYFLLKYNRENKIQYGIIALLFGMLAVLSNFTSFNYFLPFLGVLFLFTLLSGKKIWLRLLTLGAMTGVFLYLVIPVAFELKERGELYFGGRRSFYHDTLLSLSRTFAYHELNISLADIVFALLFFLALLFSGINIFRAVKSKKIDHHLVLALVFLLSILSPVLQHAIFDTCFPTERTAVLYYPVMMLVVISGIDKSMLRLQSGFLTVIAFLFLSQTIVTANTTHCYSWKYDAGTKSVMAYLEDELDRNKEPDVITVGIDYLYSPSIWFYRDLNSLARLGFHQVVECWEYDMRLEELQPKYYGTEIMRKDKLSREDADRIASKNLHYYYLNDFVVGELKRHGYSITVKKHFPNAGSSLIKIEK